MCSHAPRIPTNGLDKPFLELRLVQRGLDKLASHCCASFFLSSGFKAKLGQKHCFETPRWPDSIYVVWCGSQHTEPTADPLPPHPTVSAFLSGTGASFWGLHTLLALPVSVGEFGSVVRDPGARLQRHKVRGHWAQGLQSIRAYASQFRALHSLLQRCWYKRKAEGMNPFPINVGSSEWHAKWRNQAFVFTAFLQCSNLGSSHDAKMQEELSFCLTSDKGALPLCLLKQAL